MGSSIMAILVCIMASIASAQTPGGGGVVTLKSLLEKRELSLEKSDFAGWNSGIELSLHVDGADVQGARKYGKIALTQAVDDVGTDLSKKGEGPKAPMKEMREIRKPMSFGNRNEAKTTGFDFDLDLPTPSARSAKSINVSGTFQVVVGGEKKVVEVKPIKASLGKTVDDPALKAVGVTVEIVDPGTPAGGASASPAAPPPRAKKRSAHASISPDATQGLSLMLSGKLDEIAQIDILDAAGKKLNNGSMSQETGGKRLINYGIDGGLPKDAVLHIEVWPGQKTLTVPFELKDVKLP
jgi:hypothetical protein